jgi:hypothetical protein
MRGWHWFRGRLGRADGLPEGLLRSRRSRLVAGGTATFLLAAAGGALAAAELASPSAPNAAILSNAAAPLGVSHSVLPGALVKAIDGQIDAQVRAGAISRARASAIEARLDSRRLPPFALGGERMGPRRGGVALGAALRTAESYLGLSGAQIRADLGRGETLAQVAAGQGKSVDGLVSAVVSAAESKLAGAVAAGRLTSSQEATIEANLRPAIVDGTASAAGFGRGTGFFGDAVLRGELRAAAAYLGLTTAQVRSDIQSGQTLAQIAAAQGKTADGLVAALVAATKARLARAVSAGAMTSAQAQSIEATLSRQMTDIVNGTGPAGGFRPGFGRGFGFGFGRAGNPGFGGAAVPAGGTTTG